ncbi:MAG TPA: hypothetical protein EYH34_16955, partial [Planctomycetes bacterium]|nr:hypothetical protein [Planctomycetota bacterium]
MRKVRRVRYLPVSLLLVLALVVGDVLAAEPFFDHFTDSAGTGWLRSTGESRNHVVFGYDGTHLYIYDDGTGPMFPLVGRNDAFNGINGYWRLSLRFRFQNVTAYGTTLASGTAPFDADSRQTEDQPPRADWHDVLTIHQFNGAFSIDAFGTQHYNVGGGDTAWHTVELEVNGGPYVLRLDGAQIGTGTTGGRVPVSLWFGSYFIQNYDGNFTDIQVDWVRVETDREPPSTTASPSGTVGSGGWYRSDVQVTLSATDAWSGVASTEYRVDGGGWQTYAGPFTVTGEGGHTVEYRSTDNAGNTEPARTLTLQIDTTPPATTADLSGTLGQGGWYVSDVRVSLSAVDGTSGVAVTEYRIDGGLWHVYHGPFTVSGDGSHTVEYRSTDNAGNAEDTRSVSVPI